MTTAIANPWGARAEELARWALTRLVNRTDRCGGCYGDPATGDVRRTTRPAGGAKPGYVDLRLLARHFRASATEDVIGLHALGADGFGKWVGVDIDAHPGTTADPEANERFALAIYDRLAVLGFTPLLSESNGKGGYHVRALFEGAVEGPVLFAFGRWLVRDATEYGFTKPPEVFPKQAVIDGDTKYGNWLRLIGRHHGRDYWGRVWSGSEWLDGEAAVEYVLGIGGDPVELIPDEARTFDPNPRPVPSAPHPHVPLAPGGSTDPETDVFAAYNRAQTMESVGELLKRHRWVPVGRRGERWDFRRPDKNGDKSGNLMLVSGVPIFYGFTDAAGIPDHKGLNPSNLRAALEYPGQFARLAEQLRREGYGPQRPVRVAQPPPPPPPTAAPQPSEPPPGNGVGIILDHFRATYRPDFRRGNAIHTASGEMVPMTVATAVPTSALIARLEGAADAPRTRDGSVNRPGLPKFFSTWAKVAWGDLIAALPDEDHAALGPGDLACDEFRALVKNALLSQIVLGNTLDKYEVNQHERRSVIDWCAKFAKPGPWRSIRSFRCWTKCRSVGGTIELLVAVRHELFAQLKADRLLCDLTANTFARRCARYGIGTSSRNERPEGESAVVLCPEFVTELTAGITLAIDDSDPHGFWSGSEKPNSEGADSLD
ncbi:unnamed protein product [Gemmata massiliana]|uniref:DNA primase/polymerase bifunctional N-terminal domain-containing protein n=1 Tax=Gemmata massiliana TaxID=1210884 RepID=A0A6P2DII2_9BACT|nr:hypothetical protein [Gemmata massiliana]VTS01723.1 unnamed protein product [Gemmata massiliana]